MQLPFRRLSVISVILSVKGIYVYGEDTTPLEEKKYFLSDMSILSFLR